MHVTRISRFNQDLRVYYYEQSICSVNAIYYWHAYRGTVSQWKCNMNKNRNFADCTPCIWKFVWFPLYVQIVAKLNDCVSIIKLQDNANIIPKNVNRQTPFLGIKDETDKHHFLELMIKFFEEGGLNVSNNIANYSEQCLWKIQPPIAPPPPHHYGYKHMILQFLLKTVWSRGHFGP